MKKSIILIFIAAHLVFGTHARADNKPDPAITPGETVAVDLDTMCQKGYSKSVRKTKREAKKDVYAAYGITNRDGYKIDHLVPLSIGGADTKKNMWPSYFKAESHNAFDKDRLELKILHLVCSKKLSLSAAQNLFVSDWTRAYDEYCPNADSCPSYEEIRMMREIEPSYKPYE